MSSYDHFLKSPTAKSWKNIGVKQRAGVATPLFSIYSKSSVGIGEFPDLELMAQWCQQCGMSILQLLPLNDVGYKFTPYDALSSFALDPLYLSLRQIVGVNLADFEADLAEIQKQFPAGGSRVNYEVKGAKMELLFRLYGASDAKENQEFQTFRAAQKFWLDDYAVYKVLKEKHGESSWMDWPEPFKTKDIEAISDFKNENSDQLLFHEWIQWQLFLQAAKAKVSAREKNVFLMGDLPFLVSRDSADVWAHQEYFKLDLASGAPPDPFFAKGQRWGMPPYDWKAIEKQGYDYLKEKMKYAENFFDMFRIDHAVGLFRVWTIPLTEPEEQGGLNGEFDPPEESTWEAHGKKILDVMLESTSMLPCAEDLGTVPECSFKVLKEYGIPGMDIQRWIRDWGKSYDFKDAETYRENSIAVVSTHDMSSLRGWWDTEANTVDEIFFQRQCEAAGIQFEEVSAKLFEPSNAIHGRLHWNPSLQDEEALLKALDLPEDKAWSFLDMFRATSTEKEKFKKYLSDSLEPKAIPNSTEEGKAFAEFARAVMNKANRASSIFSIQLLQDWLSCDPAFQEDSFAFRINTPGTISPLNWSLVMPMSLDDLLGNSANSDLSEINKSRQST